MHRRPLLQRERYVNVNMCCYCNRFCGNSTVSSQFLFVNTFACSNELFSIRILPIIIDAFEIRGGGTMNVGNSW